MEKLIGILVIISSILVAMHIGNGARNHAWFQNIFCQGKVKVAEIQNICQGKVKVARIQVYAQDVLSGENQTVFEVARASITSNSSTSFGQVRVVDDLITAEPDINSEKVGRIQGLITSADMETSAYAMNLNFYFTSGDYNGSTISMLGRNQIDNAQRELALVGGTGVFRFARGYAITRTYSYDVEASYGVLEYTLYVTYVNDSSVSLQAKCDGIF